jgi:hypothetical protein
MSTRPKTHEIAAGKGPQYRGQDERGTLWLTRCGRVSSRIAFRRMGAVPGVRLTCRTCRRLRS